MDINDEESGRTCGAVHIYTYIAYKLKNNTLIPINNCVM